MTPRQLQVFAAIEAERAKQDEKWGVRHGQSSYIWHAVLSEEVGEVAKEVLENCICLEDELVQVAAVAVAWLEDIYSCKEEHSHEEQEVSTE